MIIDKPTKNYFRSLITSFAQAFSKETAQNNGNMQFTKTPQMVVGGRPLSSLLRGFSLIEIMVVVTLMAILAGLGTVYFMGRLEQGKITTARTQAYEIAKALDLYKLQTGTYPTQAEGLEVLVTPPRGPAIMEKLPEDPWSRPYNYANPGTHNPKSLDVWSDGPNGQGGDEAIGNWPAEESEK